MTDLDFPAPTSGFVITHFLVVSDQHRSREFYVSLFGGSVVLERDPVIIHAANTWLILNEGGGPTDDKPQVTLAPPADPNLRDNLFTIRVDDCRATYELLRARGGTFLTPPVDHGSEIRCFLRDPDGHLFELSEYRS